MYHTFRQHIPAESIEIGVAPEEGGPPPQTSTRAGALLPRPARVAATVFLLVFVFLTVSLDARPAHAQGSCATCLGYCAGDPECPDAARCGGDTTSEGRICSSPSDCTGDSPTCSSACMRCVADESCGDQGPCVSNIDLPVSAVILQGTKIDGRNSSTEENQPQIRAFIEQAIDRANLILAQAGICLRRNQIYFEPVTLRAPNPGVGEPDITFTVDFGTGFDSSHNIVNCDCEKMKLDKKATDLANNPPPPPFNLCWPSGGRGFVLVFANCLAGDTRGVTGPEGCTSCGDNRCNGPNPPSKRRFGQSATGDLTTPVVYIDSSGVSGSLCGTDPRGAGFVIAHEFGHLFGDLGHDGDSGNLMEDASCGGLGADLKDFQIEAIREGAPSRAVNSEHGSWQDDVGDTSQEYVDLNRGHLFIADLGDDLEFAFSLRGLFPDFPVQVSLEAFLDTDNDTTTGAVFDSFVGIDKVLRISLTGSFPFQDGSSAELIGVLSGDSTPLTQPATLRSVLWADVFPGFEPPDEDFVNDHDWIRQSVPLSALGPLGTTVPIGIKATDLDTDDTDFVSLVFSLSGSPFCNAGGPYTAECQGAATDVDLDGTGAFDPDGDPLMFSWSTNCPGGGFDDDMSPTPTLTLDSIAPCPLTCNVFLTVDDGTSTDSCETTVTIDDTADPTVDCGPEEITIRCDEEVPAFTPTAEDNCDNDLQLEAISGIAPTDCPADPIQEFIERSFTATDDCGNSASCGQSITVLKLVLNLDIKPGSCPNAFNPNSGGWLPVSLLGTDTFDVSTIDLATVQVSRADCAGSGVAVIRSTFEDAGTPLDGTPCDCHILTEDGVTDLSLKFKKSDVVAALELEGMAPGESVELVVSGRLIDGCEFIATDCVRLGPPGNAKVVNEGDGRPLDDSDDADASTAVGAPASACGVLGVVSLLMLVVGVIGLRRSRRG